MKRLFFTLSFILFLYSTLISLNPGFLQEENSRKTLQHEASVTLKLIQVYVTDKEGNPVSDLKKKDFCLWDNKTQQRITDFETHFFVFPTREPVSVQAAEISEKVIPSPPPVPMNRKFFIFLDIQRNDPIGVIKSKRVARYFVETQLVSGDEAGVFSFQPSAGFVLHQYLTPDMEKVIKTIKKARAIPGVDLFPTGSSGPSWGALAKPLNVFFYALEDLSVSLQYIPGIKNIVLFSSGAGVGAKQMFETLGSRLASSNCRVYTVDTNWKRHYLKGYYETGPGSALKQLAISSGGKHFEDPDEIEAISQDIQQMTSNYYVLGYYVEQEWNGEFHETKIEVKGKDYEIYAQKGYFNPKPYTQYSEAERKLHLADLAFSETPRSEAPMLFSLEGLPIPERKGSTLVLLSEIWPENLGEVFLNDTEIITLVFDAERNIIDSGRAVLKYDSLEYTPIHHYSISKLKPGLYECRVIVRNLVSGKSALGTTSVEVPEFKESHLNVYPPFLLIPGKESFYLKALKEEKGRKMQPLSLNELYPYLSSRHFPLVKEVDRSERNLFAVLRYSPSPRTDQKIDLKIDLVFGPSGQQIPLEFSIIESGKMELDNVLLVEIKFPYIEPDLYTLNITLSDHKNNQEIVTSRIFRIR
ncbi:VWA domain-containing protein [Acidobacteriota bacterium]